MPHKQKNDTNEKKMYLYKCIKFALYDEIRKLEKHFVIRHTALLYQHNRKTALKTCLSVFELCLNNIYLLCLPKVCTVRVLLLL